MVERSGRDHASAVALFGGSGATGLHVATQAVRAGLRVRALVRGERTSVGISNTQVLTGSLLNPGDVEETLCGTDVVCCLFAPHSPYTDIFCADATGVIIDAMCKRGIHRLVCLTGAMIGDYPHNRTWPFGCMVYLLNRRNPALAKDRAQQERLVIESDLQWTIIKPPRLTNGHPVARWRAGRAIRVGLLSSISRADVAAFIVKEIVAPAHLNEAVFISS